MLANVVLVRCPRCGSTDAESIGAVGVELDRMRCGACGHEEICDSERIKDRWNETVEADELRSGLPPCRLPGARFAELWIALGARGHGWDVFRRVRAHYGEPGRAYHDASHIGACLRLFDEAAVRALAEHPPEIEAALWFHDVIYDPRAGDNEERSAQLVEDVLGDAGVGPERCARIAAHVRATKDHVARSPDTQLVLDLDLSILGTTPDVYAAFERAVRLEYAWVPEDAYVVGRSGVLGGFLERARIYGTALFRDRFEARARTNLATALAALRARAPGETRA